MDPFGLKHFACKKQNRDHAIVFVLPFLGSGNPYSLSVRTSGVKIKHFRVYFDELTKKFYLWQSVQFPSLEEMISYYHCKLPYSKVGGSSK